MTNCSAAWYRRPLASSRLPGAPLRPALPAAPRQPQIREDPLQVVLTVSDAGHEGVPQEVVQPVGVKLRRDDVGDEGGRVGAVVDRQDVLYHSGLAQQAPGLAPGVVDDEARPLFVLSVVEHLFVQVRERPVPDVVQERGGDRHQARPLERPPLLRDLRGGEERVEDPLRHEGDAQGVGEPRVLRAVKRQKERAELADAPQPLELARVDQVDDELLPLLVEADRSVDRVAQVFVRQETPRSGAPSVPVQILRRRDRIRQHRKSS